MVGVRVTVAVGGVPVTVTVGVGGQRLWYRSIRVRLGRLWYAPTAQTSPGPAAATPRSELMLPSGFGLGTSVQAVPSQWMVVVTVGLLFVWPTAHTSFA